MLYIRSYVLYSLLESSSVRCGLVIFHMTGFQQQQSIFIRTVRRLLNGSLRLVNIRMDIIIII